MKKYYHIERDENDKYSLYECSKSECKLIKEIESNNLEDAIKESRIFLSGWDNFYQLCYRWVGKSPYIK